MSKRPICPSCQEFLFQDVLTSKWLCLRSFCPLSLEYKKPKNQLKVKVSKRARRD